MTGLNLEDKGKNPYTHQAEESASASVGVVGCISEAHSSDKEVHAHLGRNEIKLSYSSNISTSLCWLNAST